MKNWFKENVLGIAIVVFVIWLIIPCIVFIPPTMIGQRTPVARILGTNFPNLVQESAKGVVHISCPQWQGSGFVISEHLIATARHVVEGVEDFEITLNNGEKLHATRAISSKKYDIGFIWVDNPNIPESLELASIENCRLGQQVYILGSPYGRINFNAVSLGIISGLNRDWNMTDPYTGEKYGWEIAFTSDSAAHPGNSGCPVFTMDGKVRGILVGGFSPVLNCSMPCDLFLSDIDEIERMFRLDEYQFEKMPVYSPNDYYNHIEDNEYY